jgi:hypothetical protein
VSQKGGVISVVAGDTTTVAGTLSAEGGSHGSGGFVDTSGQHVHVTDSAKISTLAANGKTGTWLIDPQDFTIAASGGDITGATLSSELNSNDVLIQSIAGAKSGNGDIFVDDSVSWTSGSRLTLEAYRNIVFSAPVTIAGTGGLTLIDADQTQISGTPGMNDGNAADGNLEFNGNGAVTFTDVVVGNTQGSLTINGESYTLENDLVALANAININSSGHFALANSYDASTDGTYTSSPVTTIFSGTFEGLGNTISNLTIVSDSDEVGLFSVIFSGGEARDFVLANTNVTGQESDGAKLGALAGENDGTIEGVIVSGAVSGSGSVGGLVGQNLGEITNSGSNVAVIASTNVGGLVGANAGTISRSWASGTVSATDTADVGGLAGLNEGNVSQSFATGNVTGGFYVGGLIGFNEDVGTISQSYSTGSANAAAGSDVGGLVGVQSSGGSIAQSYATGAVNGGEASDVGGLVGSNDGSIDESYELGSAVGGMDAHSGGLVGDNEGSAGGTTSVYFNSKANTHGVGIGNKIAAGGGLSRAQMQTASNFAGWTFGSLGSGANWVIVDLDGDLNNANTSNLSVPAGGTTPMLLSEYSTTITNAHQLQLMELDLGATYTLANDIDANATRSGANVWGSQEFISIGPALDSSFEGTFDGAGHTISNLFINDTSNMFVGLFGSNNGAISNVSLVDVSIQATQGQDNLVGLQVGGLVGANGGQIENASISGSVTVSNIINGNQGVGGLVGVSLDGSIISSSSSAHVGLSGSYRYNLAAGGLVGLNTNGSISKSYSTGSVSVKGMNSTAGGLVGLNFGSGSISQSWSAASTTAVSSATGSGSGSEAGGLLGENDGGFIFQSYAVGPVAVSGGAASIAGGLVAANNQGTISQSYAIGIVTGGMGAELGGFVGNDYAPGDITGSYFDTMTSGIGAAQGAGSVSNDVGIIGLTTAQLQSGLPTGFSSSVWAVLAGTSFPYLQWQFNGTPEVVSGILHHSISGAGLSGRTISLMQNGVDLDSVLTGGAATSYANGFYYFLLSPGTIGASSGVIAYNVAKHAEAFYDLANGSVTGLDLTENYLRETTAQDALSAVNADLLSADGGNNLVTAANLEISETGTDLNIDQAIDSATVDIISAGTITESSAGVIDATQLEGSSSGNAVMNGSNAITNLAAFTAGGTFALTDADDLTVKGAVKAGANTIDLTTKGKKHDIVIDAELKSAAIDLISAATISENSFGSILAAELTGSAQDAVTLTSAKNAVADLDAFSTADHAFNLTDDHGLTVDGQVKAGTAAINLTTVGKKHNIAFDSELTGGTVTLVTTGEAMESGAGAITASLLNVTANRGIDLTSSSNKIKKLGTDSTKKGPNKLTL